MTAERLHVAYVCGDRGVPVGGRKGASAHVWEMCRGLVRAGADVEIVAARTHDGGDLAKLALPVADIGGERLMRQARQALMAQATSARAQARVSETFSLMLNLGLARELERLQRRWRVDAVYERYSLWSYAGAVFARSLGVPFLLEVNAPLRSEQSRYRSLDNRAAAGDIESFLFRDADAVLVPAAELRPYVIGRGARPSAVLVVPNAADPELFEGGALRVASTARQSDVFTVGFLGTLKPWHGVETLLQAFRRLHRLDSTYRLLIAGDGPLRMALQRSVRAWGLASVVTFAGEVEHADVPAALARMDVAVAPYPRLAGFYFSPLKVFEYLAAGVPVVASEIGQLATMLTHERDALLCKPGSVTDLFTQIRRVREDSAAALQMARRGRRLVLNRFTWDRNAGRVLKCIERAHSRRAARAGHGSR